MSPVASGFVKRLILRPQCSGTWLPGEDGRPQAESKWSLIKRYMTKKTRYDAVVVLRYIAELNELTSLALCCYPWDDWRLFKRSAPFVDAAFTAHGSRLRRIALNIPLEGLEGVLLLSVPALEELHLTLRIVFLTTDPDTILPSLVDFIHRHSSSLNTLEVDTPKPLVNPSSLYRNLSQLPRLTKLSISHPLERFLSHESTGIDIFLKNNRHTLVELRFHLYHPVAYYPPPPDAFFSHPIFEVAFPLLEVLHLGLCRWSNNSEASVKDNLSRCLASFGNSGSLTKLAILECVLRLEQLQAILFVVGERTPSSDVCKYIYTSLMATFSRRSRAKLPCSTS
ncbi:hypothetical protein NLJ89_g4867 [Agrocybe chaxingu]|uniref:Uncharacterized protein n=1 Tax=Agrocybe chaxingu TaxID=84603 RepID=A0A9W8K292_9AGAR|nr:hypothetical protein NLJ89_g4867 [Agrocybe chaxingu]